MLNKAQITPPQKKFPFLKIIGNRMVTVVILRNTFCISALSCGYHGHVPLICVCLVKPVLGYTYSALYVHICLNYRPTKQGYWGH